MALEIVINVGDIQERLHLAERNTSTLSEYIANNAHPKIMKIK